PRGASARRGTLRSRREFPAYVAFVHSLQTRSGLVALDVDAERMKKDCFVFTEAIENDLDDISRSHQARVGVTDDAATLEMARVQPAVDEVEPPAAVIDFLIVAANDLSAARHHRVFRQAIPNAGHVFGEMN